MEKKFTKGKWISLGTRVGVDIADGISSICEMSIWMSGKEVVCNSQLIAAAPDLFEALEYIYNDKEVWSELSDTQKMMVERAIKKAIE